MHSNKCAECGKYIDEDALYCIDCLSRAAKQYNYDKAYSTTNSYYGNSYKKSYTTEKAYDYNKNNDYYYNSYY